VTQLLRQGDSSVFKRYSQAKLAMMREALTGRPMSVFQRFLEHLADLVDFGNTFGTF
jgi:hypothetical protein